MVSLLNPKFDLYTSSTLAHALFDKLFHYFLLFLPPPSDGLQYVCNRILNVQQNLTFKDQYHIVLVEHKLGDIQYKNGLKQNHDLKTKLLDFIES